MGRSSGAGRPTQRPWPHPHLGSVISPFSRGGVRGSGKAPARGTAASSVHFPVLCLKPSRWQDWMPSQLKNQSSVVPGALGAESRQLLQTVLGAKRWPAKAEAPHTPQSHGIPGIRIGLCCQRAMCVWSSLASVSSNVAQGGDLDTLPAPHPPGTRHPAGN